MDRSICKQQMWQQLVGWLSVALHPQKLGLVGTGAQDSHLDFPEVCGNQGSSDILFAFPTIRPPSTSSDSVLLHTNHKMICAIHVCIYAVYHYVSSVYSQSCYQQWGGVRGASSESLSNGLIMLSCILIHKHQRSMVFAISLFVQRLIQEYAQCLALSL